MEEENRETRMPETLQEQPQFAPAEDVSPQPGVQPSRSYDRKAAKAQAKEDVRDLAREIKADRKMRRMLDHQHKIEEHEKYPTGHLRRKARRLRWKKE